MQPLWLGVPHYLVSFPTPLPHTHWADLCCKTLYTLTNVVDANESTIAMLDEYVPHASNVQKREVNCMFASLGHIPKGISWSCSGQPFQEHRVVKQEDVGWRGCT